MATQTGRLTRRARSAAKWTAATLLTVAALFLLSAWIGSSIPRNAGWQEAKRGVDIMVETNGVHTAIVMPLVTAQKDWRGEFPASDIAKPDRPYTHVSVSWGEKRVLLDTPTWWDLSPVTVLRIVGIGGDGLLHVAHYVRPAGGEDIRKLTLRPNEYARLVAAIEASLPEGNARKYPGYAGYDVFYDAPGRYSPANTCNQWTSNALAAAGVRTGRWTPLAGGVMKWVHAR